MPHKVLLFRPGALGDTLLTLPLIHSIQVEYPNRTLIFIGDPRFKIFIPDGVEFISIEDKGLLWLFQNDPSPEESQTSYALAYVISRSPTPVVDNLRSRVTGMVFWATSRLDRRIHIVEHVHNQLRLPIPERRALLVDQSVTNRDSIWIHPGSGGRSKCAPLEYFLHVARLVKKHSRKELVVTASEADDFLKTDRQWPELLDLADEFYENVPLSELCRRMNSAAVFVGNDSGIAHLAGQLGCRCLVHFVTTDPIQWSPWIPTNELYILNLRRHSLKHVKKIGESILSDFF